MNTEFMQKAINIAKLSGNDLPIGAVIVQNNKVLAQACNKKEESQIATRHAEIEVIEIASKKKGNWRLDDCDLYVTLEPCPMCAWAILQSRIKNVFFGSFDSLYGAFGSRIDIKELLNSKTEVKGGILEEDCNNILKNYFEKIRNDNKNKIK